MRPRSLELTAQQIREVHWAGLQALKRWPKLREVTFASHGRVFVASSTALSAIVITDAMWSPIPHPDAKPFRVPTGEAASEIA